MVIDVFIGFLAIVLNGIYAEKIGVGPGIFPDHPDVMAALREAVFPGGFQLPGRAFHGQQ
jgi:hypothetical protein